MKEWIFHCISNQQFYKENFEQCKALKNEHKNITVDCKKNTTVETGIFRWKVNLRRMIDTW